MVRLAGLVSQASRWGVWKNILKNITRVESIGAKKAFRADCIVVPVKQSNYIVAGRKPGFFVKFKEGETFNRRNTWRILRIKI